MPPTSPITPDPVTAALIQAAQGNRSAIPGASPDAVTAPAAAAPTAPGGFNLADIVRQVTQLPEWQAPTSALGSIQGQEQDINKARSEMPLPQVAPKNALVRALLNITGPGRAVNAAIYQPGVTAYEQKQKSLADQLANLKDQAAIPTEELKSLGQMAGTASLGSYRGGELENQRVANQIRQQRVDEYGKMVENRLTIAMRGLDLKQAALGSQIELNKARAALDRVMPEILQQRNDLINKGIDVRSATQMTVENVRAQLGIDEKHPVTRMIDNWLGTGLTPAAPETPGPEASRAPSPLPNRKKPTPDQANRANKVKSAKDNAKKPVGNTVNF